MADTSKYEAMQSIREIGKLGKKCLVIIPCYNEEKFLFEHLEALQKQTGAEFDVAIIISGAMDADALYEKIKKKKYKFGALLAQRKFDTGSAGGFFLGEKLALERGHECVIFADVDGIPEQGDLVQKLLKEFESGQKLVVAKNNLQYGGKTVKRHGCLHHYGLVSCHIMRRCGLHYAPLYLGADDYEYSIRLAKEADAKIVDRSVRHPFVVLGSKNFDREAVYNVNMALFGVPGNFSYYMYISSFLCACFLAFGTKRAREYAKTVLWALLFRKYGAELSASLRKVEPQRREIGELENYGAVLSPIKSMGGKNVSIIGKSHSQNEGAKFFEGFSFIPKVFGKETLAFLASGNIIATSMIFAKKVWVKEGEEAFLIADNSNPLLWLCKMGAFFILLPGLVCFALITLLLNIARKENTWRYGLGGKRVFG